MFKKEYIILIIIVILIVIIKFIKQSKIFKKCTNQNNNEKYPFETTSFIMSNAELNFYHNIKEVLTNEHSIFTKVRMEDIIQVKKQTKNKFGLRNKIKSRHIDFVICDTRTGKIQRAIELNDSSHNKKDRINRDIFVNEAFKAAGITLLTVKVKKSYTRKDIERLFD